MDIGEIRAKRQEYLEEAAKKVSEKFKQELGEKVLDMAHLDRDISVSKESSKFFYEQCMGSHNGQMASIPNNPVIKSICVCHGVHDKCNFVKFLREVADNLENEGI